MRKMWVDDKYLGILIGLPEPHVPLIPSDGLKQCAQNAAAKAET